MKNAKVLDQNEVKEVLADYFNVPPECIIKSKYSYIIIEKERDTHENDIE